MLLASGIKVTPDSTFFIELGIFLSAVFVLNSFIFKDALKNIELRKSKTDGAILETEKLSESASKIEEARKTIINEALKEAHAESAARINEARLKAERMISEARKEAKWIEDKEAAALAEEQIDVSQEIESQSDIVARDLIGKILGRAVN